MTTTSTTRPADCIVTGPYLPGECNTPCTPGGKDCPTTTTVPTVPGSTIAPDVFHITNLPPTGGTSTMLALALVVTAGGGWATRMARRH